MNRTATDGTAALAGIWTAFGAVPFTTWKDSGNADTGLLSLILALLFVTVFFFIPVFMFVIGRGLDTHNRWWIFDPAERAKHAAIRRRMFCWLVSAGACDVLWSPIFDRLILPLIGHSS
ncbi:MAG TPA: hypothetical protein VF472_08635 [Burkholderiaceae bacterium]